MYQYHRNYNYNNINYKYYHVITSSTRYSLSLEIWSEIRTMLECTYRKHYIPTIVTAFILPAMEEKLIQTELGLHYENVFRTVELVALINTVFIYILMPIWKKTTVLKCSYRLMHYNQINHYHTRLRSYVRVFFNNII